MLNISDHGRIREISMERPPVNALNPELVERLTRALRVAFETSDAVVISGREGMFSAGLDVVELLRLDRSGMTDFWTAFSGLVDTIACSPVPVSAAVTGHAPAGGTVICLMCDYRVMRGGDYGIGLNETRVGLVIPGMFKDAMARLTGSRIAEQMVVTGTLVKPQEAFDIGLVDALESSHEATVQHALDYCGELLALPRHAMLGNRAMARAHFRQSAADGQQAAIDSFVDGWFSADTQRMLNTLLERLKGKKK